MMSHPLSIDTRLVSTFLDEYLTFRFGDNKLREKDKISGSNDSSWSEMLRNPVGFWRKDKIIRTLECEDCKKLFTPHPTFEQCWNIISIFLDIAVRAEGETKFSSDSEYAKACHAVRTYFIKKVRSVPEYNTAYEKKLNELKNELDLLDSNSLANIDSNSSAGKLLETRIKLRDRLFLLHHRTIIHEAWRNNVFVDMKPDVMQIAKIPKIPGLRINSDIPFIYQEDYYIFYVVLIISPTPNRESKFIDFLKLREESGPSQNKADALDTVYELLKVQIEKNNTTELDKILNFEAKKITTPPIYFNVDNTLGEIEAKPDVGSVSVLSPGQGFFAQPQTPAADDTPTTEDTLTADDILASPAAERSSAAM